MLSSPLSGGSRKVRTDGCGSHQRVDVATPALHVECAAPKELRPIESFYGDGQALVADFLASQAVDLPPHLQVVYGKMYDAFVNTHGRARFNTLFRLTRSQAITVSTWAGGGEEIVDTMEQLAGFKFAPSLELPSVVSDKQTRPRPQKNTISGALQASGQIMDETLPEYCFSVVKTHDPKNNTISEDDLTAFTDAVLQHCAVKHKSWKIGMGLARIYGAQAKARLPHLPNYGKTPGFKRNLVMILHGKGRNRQYVCSHAPALLLLALLCSHTPCFSR